MGKRPSGAPKYADGNGNTWGGMGPRPRWLREALSEGKKLEDFATSNGSEQGGQQVDAPQGDAATEPSARKGTSANKRSAKQGAKPKAAFTDGTQTWSGKGPRPGWLKKALAAGRTLEEFRAP